MKRWIHGMQDSVDSSSKNFKNIDGLQFTGVFVDALKQMLPKNCWPKAVNGKDGYEIQIENVPSTKRLIDALKKSLAELGYDVYDIEGVDDEGYEFAAVKGEAFVKLNVDIGDYFNNGEMGYIDMKFDNGNVLFQDWYEG